MSKKTIMKSKQREESPGQSSTDQGSQQQDTIPVSPITARRKTEFRLTRLQSEVMTRAKSTLFGLGDVWKSKMNGFPQSPTSPSPTNTSTPPRSPKNQSAVKNTFEFFWPRRAKSQTRQSDNSENNLNLAQKGSIKSKDGKSSKKASGESSKSSKSASNKKGDRQSRSLKTDDRNRRLSRNQSVDMSELYREKQNRTEEFSRSLDDGIHYLSDGYEDDYYNFRPRSYNDTFDYLDEFDNTTRTSYDDYYQGANGEPHNKSGSKRNADLNNKTPTNHSRHILFNDEDDVIFFKTTPSPAKGGNKKNYYDSAPMIKPLPNSKDIPGILHTRSNSYNRPPNRQDDSPIQKKRVGSHKDLSRVQSSAPEPKVISARLKIQPPAKDDLSFPSKSPVPKRDLFRYNSTEPRANQNHTDRKISTVIIEERERDITTVDDGDDERSDDIIYRPPSDDNSGSSNSNNGTSHRKAGQKIKKQPSFDLGHQQHKENIKSETLPRISNCKGATKKRPSGGSNDSRNENESSDNIENSNDRLPRSNSLDLELEVIYLI